MLRWISNSRVSLQRLGFCKLGVAICESCHSRSELVETIQSLLQMPATIPSSPKLLKWLSAGPKWKTHLTTNERIEIPRQYYWIFKHPSHTTGWLSKAALAEYFQDIGLPFLLGLLDDECNKTELGELLMVLQNQNEKNALWEPPQNPITLTKADQTLFIFSLLKNDGDFLIPFMQALIKHFGDNTFTSIEAGNLIPDVIEEILQRFTGAVYTSSDQEEYLKLKDAKTEISKNIERKAETEGFGSRREQTAVPRLEWLVDSGILSRIEGQKYRYLLTPRGREFTKLVYSSYLNASNKGYVDEAVDKVLNDHFMRCVQYLLYGSTDKLTEINDIIQFLSSAYVKFGSVTGYCLVRPLLLLSHIQKWDMGQKCALEYNQVIQALEEAYQQNPNRFYFTTARFGEDYQIKFESISSPHNNTI